MKVEKLAEIKCLAIASIAEDVDGDGGTQGGPGLVTDNLGC